MAKSGKYRNLQVVGFGLHLALFWIFQFSFAQQVGTGERASVVRGEVVQEFDWNPAQVASANAEFDRQAAFAALESICKIGPRPSGSEGMLLQRTRLRNWFEKLGAEVAEQPFQAYDPSSGLPVQMVNLCVRFHPERKKRLLICCHYDTRPFPDRDKQNPRGEFLGANDGASGIGLLTELGRHIAIQEGKWGIDLVFFDGEELVYVAGRDRMFLGSEYFAQQYASNRWDVRYQYAVLVDMIADRDLQVYFEVNSMKSASRICKSIWAVAKEMKVTEFIAKEKHQVRDDHLPLIEIARIPTCDIIDFDYPNEKRPNEYWHTLQDTPENCSAESLGKVGAVLLEWLRQLQKL